jgi:hypothetical protein
LQVPFRGSAAAGICHVYKHVALKLPIWLARDGPT